MATITINSAIPVRKVPRGRSALGRVFDAIVESRARTAERIVGNHLIGLDADMLKAHGLDRAALRRKAGGAYL